MNALALVLLTSIYVPHSFTHVQNVTPGAAGPNRLDAAVPLLASSAPGFRDLRLYDRNEREVPYLLIEPPRREPQWVRGTLLEVATTKTTSGFEADLGSIREIDRLRLHGISAPFLKHVTLEASGDRAHWTVVADTTVFDLPDQNLQRSEIAFEAGRYRYLRVTWDDRSSARVERVSAAEARLHDVAGVAEPLRETLPVRRLSSEPGRSRYRLDLPGPRLPIAAIEVNVAGGDVFRNATITEPQLTNGSITPVTLGNSLLRRAVRDGYAATETAIPISAPSARELDLVIDDGGNAPLEISSVIARFTPQPWIYFESADGAQLQAKYGDAELLAPHYDLEAARQFVARAAVARARWDSALAQPVSVATPPPPPLPAFGPAVDRTAFRADRALKNDSTGLVVLPLDADVLARSNDLTDVRIIDRTARQVPYVIERRGEPLSLPLQIGARREMPEGESRYRIALPYSTLPSGTRIVLTTEARVFERTVRIMRPLEERKGREETELARAEWRNASPDNAAAPLTFDTSLTGTGEIDIAVSEGDNAPLPIQTAVLLLPSYALRFNAPPGALSIVYGNTSLAAPRYDLALLTDRLLTEPARTISFARPAIARPEAAGSERKYFWLVIGGAAVLLLVLLARLLGAALKESRSLGETPGSGDPPR